MIDKNKLIITVTTGTIKQSGWTKGYGTIDGFRVPAPNWIVENEKTPNRGNEIMSAATCLSCDIIINTDYYPETFRDGVKEYPVCICDNCWETMEVDMEKQELERKVKRYEKALNSISKITLMHNDDWTYIESLLEEVKKIAPQSIEDNKPNDQQGE